MSVRVSSERFEELVREAIDSLPEELAVRMENVAVVIEEWPSPEQSGGRRGLLLGLYEGVSLTRRGPLSYNRALPDCITIFRGPHLRIVGSVDQLRERVRTTVLHEIAHHFGISDARLQELGWA